MVTPADIIRQRFGPATEQFFSYLSTFLQPMYGAFQLLGLSIFVSVVFHIPVTGIAITLGAVVGFYSVSGGRWAVMATDFLQSLVLLPIVIAVTILGVNAAGGISNLYESLAELGTYQWSYEKGTYPDGAYTFTWMIAVFAIQFVMQLNLSFNARFFSAKDGNEARKSAMLMIGLLLLGSIFYTVPALVSRVLYADQVAAFEGILNKSAESAYVVACLNLLPNGLLGLVLVGMFSATASSMDSGLNANAAIIVRNMLPPLRRWLKLPQLDSIGEIRQGRYISIGLTVFIICLTLWLANNDSAGIFEIILGFGAAVNLPMTLPFFFVLLIPSAPRISAIFSISCGLLIPTLLKPLFAALEMDLDYAERALVVFLCSLGGFILSYAFKNRETAADKAETETFYTNLRRPVVFEEEIGASNDAAQLKLLGRLSLTIAAGVTCLLFIPNDPEARMVILWMAAGVASVGCLLLYFASRSRRNERNH
jgi:Na+/proline symporter